MLGMNYAHWHLMLNHIPILGSAIGAFVMLWGFVRKSSEVQRVAMVLFVVCAIATYPTNRTGHRSERIVKAHPEANAAGIDEHEESADWAIAGAYTLGGLSLIGLIWSVKKPELPMWLPALILLAGLFTAATMARTGYLGGKIRHTEFADPNPAPRVRGESPPPAEQH